jgi:predicted dehydrogenase
LHEPLLSTLAGAGYSGMVVVEKPLADQPFRIPKNRFSRCGVAYNMRYHPVIERLKAAVSRAPVLSVWAYVGQYLPLWRPQRDYRQSYSVSRSQGGGVLRDLSHEIDYLHHIFGDWLDIAAVGGHLSSLPGDSEDVVCLLARQERSRATGLQLNYLDRPGARRVICNTDQHTFVADLVPGVFSVDGEREAFAVARDDSYRRMWLDVLSEDFTRICSLADAQRSLEFIAAAEKAIATHAWIAA